MDFPLDDSVESRDRFHGFQDLIQDRVQDILLVSTLYDYYTLSQDGRLNEQFLGEFLELNLRHTPNISPVFSGRTALDKAESQSRYNLIITALELGDMDVLEFIAALRDKGIDTPVVLLAHERRELQQFIDANDISSIERIFLWQGDVRILLAIVKYMEDRMNVDHDSGSMGVPAIIVVEDDIRHYSSLLPDLYTELVNHSQSLMPDGLNLSDKLIRIRARPKILLCDHYEEAWEYFDRYADEVLGILSDIDFPRAGERCRDAGVQLATAVRARRADVPVMLQSRRAKNAALAEAAGASFLLKGSPRLLHHIREFMVESLRIGDFVFRLPDGTELGHASDLKTLAHMLERVPAESLAYHGARNDFSTWLKVRTEFELAEKLRPRKVTDFATLEELRASVVDSLAEYRRERNRGQVVDFDRNHFDASARIYRVGGGSLGGKARGIAFIDFLLTESHVARDFPNVSIFVPASVVLGTEVFDQFMEDNELSEFAIRCESDEERSEKFLAGKFRRDIEKDMKVFLDRARYPLAVRSSSLLEDSRHLPFAGVYETFMLPNNHTDLDRRLEQLLRAVKRVYASTFASMARTYLRAAHYRLEEEKMAVIVQKVVGTAHQSRFYPDLAGAARSHNYYPTPPADKTDGIAAVALGLGKTVEDGGSCVRFTPKYPRHALLSVKETVRSSQRDFFALDLRERNHFEPILCPLDAADEDGTLRALASTYSSADEALYDGVSRSGPRVVTLAPVLKHGVFPLAAILERLLEIGSRSTRTPVELEFAVNLQPDERGAGEFGFLQLRPLVLTHELEQVELGEVERESAICYSERVLGNGRLSDLTDVIVVDYHQFDRRDSRETAAAVSRFNQKLSEADRPYVLVGVGRWGSREPYLGIPVVWPDIAFARVIVEAGFRDFQVMPSQGTHFFQNLIAHNVGFFTVNPDEENAWVDWDWLIDQPAIEVDGHARWLRFDEPVVVTMDGTNGTGVIFKPNA